jgi:pSer/pThr/pTyr-binding forkhead associated (FHA) protein
VSEASLNILNYAVLALLYLFFARVLWAVWSEVRGPRRGTPPARVTTAPPAAARTATPDATAAAPMPAASPPTAKPVRGLRAKRGVPTKLVVLQPKVRKGSAYPITNDMNLGRATSCAIGLPDDDFASQLHARVYSRDGQVWVEDLGSTNGTHVNGARITAPQVLMAGDRLQVGATLFEAQ